MSATATATFFFGLSAATLFEFARHKPPRFAFVILAPLLGFWLVELTTKFDGIAKAFTENPTRTTFALIAGAAFAAFVAIELEVAARASGNVSADGPVARKVESLPLPVNFRPYVRGFITLMVTLSTFAFISWLLPNDRAARQAREVLENALQSVGANPARFADDAIASADTATAWPPPNQGQALKAGRDSITQAQKEAQDRLLQLQATAEQKTRAATEIDSLAKSGEAALSSDLTRGAADGRANYQREAAIEMRNRLVTTGQAAATKAMPALTSRARSQFEGTSTRAAAARARELADEMQKQLDAITREAVAAEASRVLKERSQTANDRMQRAMANAASGRVGATGSAMDAVLSRLLTLLKDEAEVKRKEELQKSARDFVAGQRSTAEAQRTARFDLLRSQFKALGFELCEDMMIDGPTLYLEQPAITSEVECAVMCSKNDRCNGFGFLGRPGARHCTIARNSYTRREPGAISGRKGSC